MRNGFCDGLIVDISIIGAVEVELEPVRITGFGEKFFGQFRIEFGPLDVRIVSVHVFADDLACRVGTAFHHVFDNFVDVDGMGDGFTHFKVFKRIGFAGRKTGLHFRRLAALVRMDVEHHVNGTLARYTADISASVFIDSGDVRNRNAPADIDLIRDECSHPGGVFRNRTDGHFRKIDFSAPPFVIGNHIEMVILDPFDELIGSCSDRVVV